jgi:hypothetical protein
MSSKRAGFAATGRGLRRPSRKTAMSGHTARVHAGNDRTSLCTEITDKIIAELAGRIPWLQH